MGRVGVIDRGDTVVEDGGIVFGPTDPCRASSYTPFFTNLLLTPRPTHTHTHSKKETGSPLADKPAEFFMYTHLIISIRSIAGSCATPPIPLSKPPGRQRRRFRLLLLSAS